MAVGSIILLPVSEWVVILGMKTKEQCNWLSSAWIYWLCTPDIPRRMGFCLGISPSEALWQCGEWNSKHVFKSYEKKQTRPIANPIQNKNDTLNSLCCNQKNSLLQNYHFFIILKKNISFCNYSHFGQKPKKRNHPHRGGNKKKNKLKQAKTEKIP